MDLVLRSVLMILLGYALLIVQSTLGVVFSLHPYTPILILPIVIFLGVSPDVQLVRGALIAFLLGYLLDLFSGNRLSVQTFVMVSVFMLVRGAGLRLFLRGPTFQVPLTFVVGFLAGAAALASRAIFEVRPPIPSGSKWETALFLAGSALFTAVAAPVVFFLAQRVEGVLATGRREEAGPTP